MLKELEKVRLNHQATRNAALEKLNAVPDYAPWDAKTRFKKGDYVCVKDVAESLLAQIRGCLDSNEQAGARRESSNEYREKAWNDSVLSYKKAIVELKRLIMTGEVVYDRKRFEDEFMAHWDKDAKESDDDESDDEAEA